MRSGPAAGAEHDSTMVPPYGRHTTTRRAARRKFKLVREFDAAILLQRGRRRQLVRRAQREREAEWQRAKAGSAARELLLRRQLALAAELEDQLVASRRRPALPCSAAGELKRRQQPSGARARDVQ